MSGDWNSDGYRIVSGAIPPGIIDALRDAFAKLCIMQSEKLGIAPGVVRTETLAEVDDLVVRLNERDSFALDHAAEMLRSTPAGIAFAALPRLAELAAELLDCPRELLVISGPSLAVNLPAKTTRLYTWHTEKLWYPKRRSFVNFWIPVFRSKMTGNGTMAVLPKSHKAEWFYFSEHFGYDAKSEGSREHNLQYEIPEGELGGFESVDMRAESGDIVLFHSNLVHRSTSNASGTPSYMVNFRAFDYRRDLTLSSAWTESPYRLSEPSRAGGRFNLRESSIR